MVIYAKTKTINNLFLSIIAPHFYVVYIVNRKKLPIIVSTVFITIYDLHQIEGASSESLLIIKTCIIHANTK